jgi:hypothetical protein
MFGARGGCDRSPERGGAPVSRETDNWQPRTLGHHLGRELRWAGTDRARQTTEADRSQSGGGPSVKRDLDLLDYEGKRGEFGLSEITGRVRNNSSRYEYEFLTLKFDVLDSDGNKIGEAVDVLAGLSPGDTWKFNMLVAESEASTFGKPRISAMDARSR